MKREKKKACVISSYAYIVEHINYGALFQYYALEKILKKKEIDAYWLRYIIKTDLNLKNILKKFLLLLKYGKNKNTVKNTLESFDKFLENYCSVSYKKYYSVEELKNDLPDADIYITGSDQVWGGTLSPNYLCFVPDNKLKCSYAASFGKKIISEEQKAIISPWLKRLDYISVRESSGVDICKKMGINAQQVLDPTLLLDASEYPIEKQKNSIDIFCYFLNINSNEQIYWNKLQEFAICKELDIGIACTEATFKYFKEEEIQFLTPEEWLNHYYNAKYIVTNTFHGTVFAIIFNKPFIVITQEGKTGKQNERIYSLLNSFNLTTRLYNVTESFQEQLDAPIDWEKVNNIIKLQRKASFEYIQMIIDK